MNYFVRVSFLILMTVTPWAKAEIVFQELLDKVYGAYDKKEQCWMVGEGYERYCMKIKRTDTITVNGHERLYLVLTGNLPAGGHAMRGLVGAFVFEDHQGKTEIIASDPQISMGSDGEAPPEWQFVRLGHSYWGWQNTFSVYHQSYFTAWDVILAPHNKQIRELAFLRTLRTNDEADIINDDNLISNNKQACVDEYKKPCTSISAKIEIDTRHINKEVFPLLVTVSGKNKGKPLKTKTWTLLFDTKEWAYIKPKQWPLKESDF